MNHHIRQAEHNSCFLRCLNDRYPEHFYDWKITSLYYICVHLVQAFADSQGISIGDTHDHIAKSLNPKLKSYVIQIPQHIWDCYHNIQRYSRESRYDGILNDVDSNNMHKENYNHSLEHFEYFKNYLIKRGIEYNADYDSTQEVA